MVSTQPSLLHLIFISRHVELEGQPTQEDFLVLEDLVRVGIMSGTPGRLGAALEEAFLERGRSREQDWGEWAHSFSKDQPDNWFCTEAFYRPSVVCPFYEHLRLSLAVSQLYGTLPCSFSVFSVSDRTSPVKTKDVEQVQVSFI